MSGYVAYKELWLEGIAQIDEETAYASCSEFNALFKVDLKTGDCTYVSLFPEERKDKKRLFIKALYVNGKIYFIPASASAIVVFHIETNSFERIEMETDITGKEYNQNCKFADAYVYKDYICILPASYPAIAKLDYVNNTLEYFVENMPSDDYLFRPGTVQIENKLLVPDTNSNLVMEFNMETDEIKLHYVGKNNNGSWSIVKDNDYLWLIPKKPGSFVKWNYLSGEISEYNHYPEGFVAGDFCFTKGYKSGAYIHVIPAKANMFLKVNTVGEMERNTLLQLHPKDTVMYMFGIGNYEYFVINNDDYVPPKRDFYRLNLCNNVAEKWSFRFKAGKECYIRDYYSRQDGISNDNPEFKENEVCDFATYMETLVKGQLDSVKKKEESASAGEKIYKGIW